MSDSQIQQISEMIGHWRSCLTPMPEELRLTVHQLGRIQSEVFADTPLTGPPAAEPIVLLGIPVTVVERDEDSTFHQEQYIRAIDEGRLT